jgi:hypothetical protein
MCALIGFAILVALVAFVVITHRKQCRMIRETAERLDPATPSRTRVDVGRF